MVGLALLDPPYPKIRVSFSRASMAATDPVTPRKLLRLRTTSRRVAAGSRDYKKQMRFNLGIVPPEQSQDRR